MLINLMKRKIGLTLTELLVVVAIIIIITLALIPAVTQRTERARVATARREVKELAMAEDSCAIATGYYIPLQLLDNIKRSTDIDDDALNNEVDTIFLIDPFFEYIDNDGNRHLPGYRPGTDQLELPTSNFNQYRIYRQWDGPYSSFVKDLLTFVPSAPTRRDFPLDPWNIPYRFFSPIGIIGSGAATNEKDLTVISSNTAFSDGRITQNLPNYSRGKWLIMSPGRNQEFSNNPDNDDIIHYFGVVIQESNYLIKAF